MKNIYIESRNLNQFYGKRQGAPYTYFGKTLCSYKVSFCHFVGSMKHENSITTAFMCFGIARSY